MPRLSLRFAQRRRARHAAAAQQVAEQAAARQRIIDLAHRDRWPGWNAPTATYRPLMTRGQATRGHGGRS